MSLLEPAGGKWAVRQPLRTESSPTKSLQNQDPPLQRPCLWHVEAPVSDLFMYVRLVNF